MRFLVLWVLAACSAANAGIISLDDSFVIAEAGVPNTRQDLTNAYPHFGTLNGNLYAESGPNFARTVYDISNEASFASFNFIFEHAVDGTRQELLSDSNNYSGSRAAIWFTPSENVRFTISGEYGGTHGGNTLLSTQLSDPTLWVSRRLFISENTADESFELGTGGGDTADFFQGSLTGDLSAGTQYRFSFQASAANRESAGITPASASLAGSVLFKIYAVPAPATLALFGLGLAGLGWSRRKKA